MGSQSIQSIPHMIHHTLGLSHPPFLLVFWVGERASASREVEEGTGI